MRIILVLFLTITALCLSAQSRKGQFLLAGDTRANFQDFGKFGGNEFWDVGTSRAGYFLFDDVLIGAEASLRTNLFSFQNPEDLRINPFLRYYISELESKKFGYFVQFGIGTFGAFTDFGNTASFETDFHVGVGAEYAVTPNLLAEGLLRYNAKAFGLNYTELSLRINVLLGNSNGNTLVPLLAKDIMVNPHGGSIQLGVRGREGVSHLIADLTLEGGFMVTNHLLAEAGFIIERDAYRADPGNFEGVRDRPLITQLTGYVGGRILLPTDRLKPYVQFRLSHFAVTTGFDDQFGRGQVTNATGLIGLGGGTFVFISENVAFDLGIRRQLAAQQQFVLDQWEGSASLKVFISNRE